MGRFGSPVEEIENAWIELSDGCNLAVRLWLPADAREQPVPAILEYLPYRKDDGTAWQDSLRQQYWAENGYAAVRVDIRGTGDSDGVLLGEYLLQEQDDALEVLAWIADQPWCSGAVGMFGYSWGGFNGLQIAARRPPELKAVVSAYSTDDRYLDDCHYMGGCLLGSDMLKWASTMLVIDGLPPDPRFVGDRWREMWMDRLERTPSFAEDWVTHQRRDDFWTQGSVAEDYEAIEAPVLLVGGWADAYTNAVPRLLENLRCPRRALIGPWAHILPQRGIPGPAIGFLHESVRWWDRWLLGEENGVDEEPALLSWMQDPAAPARFYAERPGRWVADEGWPPRGEQRVWEFGAGTRRGVDVQHGLVGAQSCGESMGVWCPNGLADEFAEDQRVDDERSLTFDTEPLTERIEVLGHPEVDVTVEVDQPLALVSVRLCDVAPDGASTLLSWGLLNLTHRDGHECPAPVSVGYPVSITVQLKVIGQAVEPGHRLRVAISPTCWPHAWPSPHRVRLMLREDSARLRLPIRPAESVASDSAAAAAASFGPPEKLAPGKARPSSERSRTIEREGICLAITDLERSSVPLESSATTYARISRDRWTIDDDDPLSARVRCDREQTLEREGWRVRVATESEMRCDAERFYLRDRVRAYEGDELVFERESKSEIERDLL